MQIDHTHPVVSRLIEIQELLDLPNKRFADLHLSLSETSWFRIKANDYRAADHTSVLKKLTEDLSRYLDREAMESTVKTQKILALSHITASRDALNMAFSEERNRIVIILADTGGGKTMIARNIARDFSTRAVLVEASESWRKSYLAGIQGIARASGISEPRNNMRQAEAELIDHLKKSPRIIVIDEGNYFGSACLNLVKAIVNQTRSIVVILAMPVLWKFITRTSSQEARQLRNRAAAILEFTAVRKADVALALSEVVPNWATLNGSSSSAVNVVTDAANSFGLWNTVFSIAAFINEESGAQDLTLDIIQQAAADVQKLRR